MLAEMQIVARSSGGEVVGLRCVVLGA